MKTLHIFNGDASADIFRETVISGDIAVWREVLMDGPVSADDPFFVFWKKRNEFMTGTYGGSSDDYQQKVMTQWEMIFRYEDYQEIVLWFEFDFFCQINLLYLLAWFHDQHWSNEIRLYLICPEPGAEKETFKALGGSTFEQLKTFYSERRILQLSDLQSGKDLWQAYSAADPTGWEHLVGRELNPVIFRNKFIPLHLQRYPSVGNGLSSSEQRILTLIGQGLNQPRPLFEKFWELESAYGMTDLQILNIILKLSQAAHPLMTLTDLGSPGSPNLDNLPLWRFNITELGEDIQEKRNDYIRCNGINTWVGGVRLEGNEPQWRYDAAQRKLIRSNLG